jgi:Mrp family chromosome partitioning ATPase
MTRSLFGPDPTVSTLRGGREEASATARANRWAQGAEPEGPSVLVVGSGKGGVGKSVLSVLLGASLAAQGHRVLLFDADHNLANLHVLLGIRPAARLEALLQGNLGPRT